MPPFSKYLKAQKKLRREEKTAASSGADKEDVKAKAEDTDNSDENNLLVPVVCDKNAVLMRDLARYDIASTGNGPWKSAVDASGKTYWYNQLTNEVSWDAPASYSSDASDTVRVPASGPTSGRPYWHSKKTRDISWPYPSDSLKTGDAAVKSSAGGLGLGWGALSCGAMDAATLLDCADSDDNDTDFDYSYRDDDLVDDDSIFEYYGFDEHIPPRAVVDYSNIQDAAGCIDALQELR